jgi:hypothetical protein
MRPMPSLRPVAHPLCGIRPFAVIESHVVTRTISSLLLLFFACASPARAQALNEWDIGFALKDLTHRAISLEYLNIDPYRVTDSVRRELDLDAPLCSVKTIKEGLINGTCNPVTLKRCGKKCVSLSIDTTVYNRASAQIRPYLREPCPWLKAMKLGPGRFDSHPSFFYLSRNRAVSALGCEATPVRIDSMEFAAGTLTIKYR